MNIELYVDGNAHAWACLLVARRADGSIAVRDDGSLAKTMLGESLEDKWTPTQSTWIAARMGLDELAKKKWTGNVFIFTRIKGLANRQENLVSWVYLIGHELQQEVYEHAETLMHVAHANEIVNAGEPAKVNLETWFSAANIIKARARGNLFVADVETARIERKASAE